MDSMAAFEMGRATRGNRMRVFDWERAARRIRESGAREASAGLSGDWEWTGGPIWADGPYPAEDTYVYLHSTWATPELDLDGAVEDCWRWSDESPGWDADTYWPESARLILLGRDGSQ